MPSWCSSTLWPDFTEADLEDAIASFTAANGATAPRRTAVGLGDLGTPVPLGAGAGPAVTARRHFSGGWISYGPPDRRSPLRRLACGVGTARSIRGALARSGSAWCHRRRRASCCVLRRLALARWLSARSCCRGAARRRPALRPRAGRRRGSASASLYIGLPVHRPDLAARRRPDRARTSDLRAVRSSGRPTSAPIRRRDASAGRSWRPASARRRPGPAWSAA